MEFDHAENIIVNFFFLVLISVLVTLRIKVAHLYSDFCQKRF